jgi:hypothetical protein
VATVFLSYRHENDAHRGRVRTFGEQLRAAGISVALDQFYLDAHPGGPNEGWPRWSKKQAAEAEKVLIIGSPGWFRCYEGKELPGTGLGASAEAVVIGQRLYKVAGVSGQIRVAVFDSADAATVPLDLEGFHRFDATAEFDAIRRWITGAAAPAPDPAGWLAAPPTFEWLLADCEPVHDAFAALLTGACSHSILLIRGGSETGKSRLTRCLLGLLLRHTPFACGRLDLKSGADLDGEYSRFVQHLGVDDAVRPTAGWPLRERLDGMLTALRDAGRPTVFIFDTFEQGGEWARWVEEMALLVVPRAPWLRVIIVGQQVPERAGAPWSHCAAPPIELQQLGWHPWYEFGKRHKPILTEEMARQIHELARGSHSLLDQLLGPAA